MSWTTTTEAKTWEQQPAVQAGKPVNENEVDAVFHIHKEKKQQTIEGFGTCFNELGWTSLGLLKEDERDTIFSELFKPNSGANFTICRMPVGCNDFSRNWYSYDETDKDFELKDFSIANDKETLIPFIHKALNFNPELKIWASPWCPPQWMKRNHHYACQVSGHMFPDQYKNDLKKKDEIDEGEDAFIIDDEYFKCYSKYFGKFIDAYKAEGINIFAVMPQNEFNSNQVFPSCVWKIESLNRFVGEYLGPEMKSRNVSVLFGTMERPFERYVDVILNDPKSSQYIEGIGFQWAGKKCLPGIHRRYPNMKLWQTEQECGDGKNNWDGAVYSWNLMCHYLNHGVQAYMYWNTSLIEGGISRWGWAQNSLVVVDEKTKKYRYTPEYYVLKHVSHFVQKGATKVGISRSIVDDDVSVKALSFVNPDGKVVIVCGNEAQYEQTVSFEVNQKYYTVTLPALSFNTLVL
ncbi:beta-glycosidase [Tritrichomonas foetus]|uniref:Beta-glycosidase n=1 Tax=Tritrichomonas foetus TaxID=1144522 RepID=A0A1J4K999_9EUKA|nr:beta-glycosidase [Tritrichomonas foetus]|eukprot:OHT08073.1 beta-glycosidase [Tritrichomonas foetus]